MVVMIYVCMIHTLTNTSLERESDEGRGREGERQKKREIGSEGRRESRRE